MVLLKQSIKPQKSNLILTQSKQNYYNNITTLPVAGTQQQSWLFWNCGEHYKNICWINIGV